MTPRQIIPIGDGFWNIRGSFKIAGFLDVKTQASLVRRDDGRFLFLDACGLEPETKQFVDELTNGGASIDAILHLHPFHTVYVRRLHAAYPRAKLYGTARHHRSAPELTWQPERTDEPSLHALFADVLTFSVPRGVDFIPENEKLHFASVLAFHGSSRTLHVDDTLCYVRLPGLLRSIKEDMLGFHPSLARVLERRAGAVRDFRAWAAELVERSRSIENLCAAHTTVLQASKAGGEPIHERVTKAIANVDGKLASHERRYG